MKKKIADLRQDYSKSSLDINDVDANPITQFQTWFDQALESEVPEPNAMNLATVGADGAPSSRTMLLKGADQRGFVFYTNFESRKGEQLNENPNAALCFMWLELQRQVRIEGVVERVGRQEAEEYFNSRPFESRVGAHASHQSTEVKSREEMDKTYNDLLEKFKGKEVPMPEYWGGYLLKPRLFEFWQGRSGRMHDRIEYRNEKGSWVIKRLSP